jgi:hypothetical protein
LRALRAHLSLILLSGYNNSIVLSEGTFLFLIWRFLLNSSSCSLILTKTSVSKRNADFVLESESDEPAWIKVVKDLVQHDGGIANLFVGLGSRSLFFFLVIGLQFFLYDYVKNLFQVGSDDLSLVLDVFYAVRAGLIDTVSQ